MIDELNTFIRFESNYRRRRRWAMQGYRERMYSFHRRKPILSRAPAVLYGMHLMDEINWNIEAHFLE